LPSVRLVPACALLDLAGWSGNEESAARTIAFTPSTSQSPQFFCNGIIDTAVGIDLNSPRRHMKRHVLIFGLIGGVLITALKWTEYRFLVIEHSMEIYGGLIAATFSVLGIWLGIRLTGTRQGVVVKRGFVPAGEPFVPNARKQEDLGITRRELEILELVAQGMSNREIAGKLYVSENTVKTHCSRAFDKLGAKRRTQAVQLGKEFGLLP
jgi:NarL family two-component system response regulator LiaR